jgi:hypothetical protein
MEQTEGKGRDYIAVNIWYCAVRITENSSYSFSSQHTDACVSVIVMLVYTMEGEEKATLCRRDNSSEICEHTALTLTY